MTLVSAIICTYNRAKVLPGAIASVLAQTHRPLQLVIVNDGSTDNTADVLREHEPEVRAAGVEPIFFTQANAGLSGARNAGLKLATGEYIAFLDDDDFWYPEKTALELAEIMRTGAGACCCMADATSPKGPATTPHSPENMLRGKSGPAFIRGSNWCWINSILARKDVAMRAGEFDGRLPVIQDDEWIARLAFETEFCAVDKILCKWKFSPQSLTRFAGIEGMIKRDDEKRLMLALFRQNCQSRPGWDEAAWNSRITHDYEHFVKHRLYNGDVAGARSLLDEAAKSIGWAPLARLKRKCRKAWWLSLFGLRVKHPKFKNLNDIRA
jgi:glycosyltransferase involved in cell wall biosynthesis